MPNLARFTVNGSPSSPGGFDASEAQVLTLALETSSSLVQRVTFEVYSPSDSASPLASKDAPLLGLVGATTGPKVDAATPAATVSLTLPSSGAHSWIVRCTVNGGLDANGRPSADLVYERMIVIRISGRRKIVASEGTQYESAGWAGAQNDDVDAPGGGGTSDHGSLLGKGDDDHLQYLRTDGARALAGDQSLGNNRLTAIKSLALNSEVDNATNTINWTAGAAQKKTASADATLVFTAPAAFTSLQLRVIGDGTPRTFTWPGGVTWLSGSPPTLASGVGVSTLLGFWHLGGGVYLGAVAGSGGGGGGGSGDIKADGTVPFAADQSMGGFKLTDLDTPTVGTDAATKSYVDAVAAGLSPRPSVKAVATANQATMTGTAQTVDGVALNTVGDRVLLTAQSTASQNGPWVVQAGAWTRPTDFAASSDAAAAYFFVQQGTTYADTGWVCTTNTGSAVVGTNNLAFVQFSAAGVPLAGSGLSKTGQTFAVVPEDASVTVGGSGIKVASQLPARGSENVVVDLYPSTQQQGTIATANTLNFDIPIAAGKRYKITADVWVDDGAGGAVLFCKSLLVNAHQTGGAAVLATNPVVIDDNAAAGWTFTAVANSTNVRFSLANTSGSTRSYNVAIGFWSMDKP